MPQHLLLDGDDLPALMLRVRTEMGPDARIVKAERIRNGGFAGFFARERYELLVEVPDPPSAQERWRAAQGRAPAGIGALLEAADAAEQAGVPVAPSWSAGLPDDPSPQVSTSGDTFAHVLESMRTMVDPTHVSADAAEPDSSVHPDPLAPVEGRAGAAAPAPTAPTAPTAPWAEALAPVPPQAAGPEGERPAAASAESGDEATVARLLELGVPARLLSGFASITAPVPLPVLVRRFDRPPGIRLEPGALVVVAGPAEETLRAATQMAQRARMGPNEVLLAGDIDSVAGHGRRMLTVSAAVRRRSSLRDDGPTIVALGVGPTPSAWAAGAELLEALDPDQAWGVVDARTRNAEMRRWIRAVGSRRPFDGVVAADIAEAQAPGTVLDLGLPVGWVDGLPASPVVWAALLSERLADDATGD